ncbi:hypothetical protein MyNCGM70_47080 [Achromobacter xylosoxidans]
MPSTAKIIHTAKQMVKAKVLDTRTRMGALAEGWVDAMVVLAFLHTEYDSPKPRHPRPPPPFAGRPYRRRRCD